MAEPIMSKNFDVEDIRKIREYNSLRISSDTRGNYCRHKERGRKNPGTASERTVYLISNSADKWNR